MCDFLVLTIFQCCSVNLRARGTSACSVKSLHNHTILGKLLQVVQGVDLTVTSGFHLHNAVLAITAWAVLPVADLVTADHTVLQLLPGRLSDQTRAQLKISTKTQTVFIGRQKLVMFYLPGDSDTL